MDVEVAFTAVPVAALATGQAYFEQLFGRPPDIVPNEREVMWRLTDTAWLYVVIDEARAGLTTVTFSVGDLDTTLVELAARGLTPVGVEDVGTAGRKATLQDPDGNTVALIEVH
jgi:hypothetical protein